MGIGVREAVGDDGKITRGELRHWREHAPAVTPRGRSQILLLQILRVGVRRQAADQQRPERSACKTYLGKAQHDDTFHEKRSPAGSTRAASRQSRTECGFRPADVT